MGNGTSFVFMEKVLEIKIEIKPMTVNRAWKGKRYKTPEYKAYTQELMLRLPKLDIPDGLLELRLTWGFSNKGSDWDNPIKITQDIICDRYGINDNRVYRGIVEKKIVEKGEEYFEFEILPFIE